MIVKGLKYAYTNIESANEVIEMIVTAVKNNRNYVTHQVSHLYKQYLVELHIFIKWYPIQLSEHKY